MGGSSSKNEKMKENKKEEITKKIENEKISLKSEVKKEEKKEDNNKDINNIIKTTNKIKEEKNSDNEGQKKEILDGIEELTLENDGTLMSNKNTINSNINQVITIELPNSQSCINKDNTNKIKDIENKKDINEDKKEEETPLIIYSEKASQELIINFYEKMIEIIYNLTIRKNFISLVKSLNESYLYNINIKNYPKTKEIDEFFNSFKYSSIIIICLIFLIKDLDLYENTKKKIKDNLEQFIYSCLDETNKDIITSLKIINFMNYSRKIKKSLYNCINQIIKILFKNKTSYQNILNCLEQLLSKIETESTQDIINKINNSILFYYNASTYEETNNNNNTDNINPVTITKRRKSMIKKPKITLKNEPSFNTTRVLYKSPSFYKGFSQRKYKMKSQIKTTNSYTNILINNNIEKTNENRIKESNINPPFIKEEMSKNKKFCLILDIDETITHLVKLPFGNYFLIRPGVIELLKELYNYYEIDIFTAALQHYADNILNKLDKDNKYFSHRLYRCHCNWEEGKSIKKLSLIGRDLTKVVFVDDIERNAKYNIKNLILVSKWSDNLYDEELINIKNKLKLIAQSEKYNNDITIGLIDEKLTKIINNDNINNNIKNIS